MSVEKVLEKIYQGRSFLLSSHINLEGDSLGSELALAQFLKQLKKDFFIYNATAIPRIYNFLPWSKLINTSAREIKEFDTVIILDCSDLDRIGKVKELLTQDKLIINIDHHLGNLNFGSVNWVEPGASAVGELIYELFQKANVLLNKDIALCLYVAILTDTGGFRFKNTTCRTHRIVSHLLEYGISPETIFEKVYGSYSFSHMKLLGYCLSNLKIDKRSGIAWMSLSKDIFKKTQASPQDSEGFIELLRTIGGVRVALLFQEIKKDRVKVGFRSKGNINVSEIANFFGGGGHFSSSGCILEGKLQDIEKRVITRVKMQLK